MGFCGDNHHRCRASLLMFETLSPPFPPNFYVRRSYEAALKLHESWSEKKEERGLCVLVDLCATAQQRWYAHAQNR